MNLQFVLATFHTRLGWSVNLVLNSGLVNVLFSLCYLHTHLQFTNLTSIGNFAIFSQDDRILGSMLKCEKLSTIIINVIHDIRGFIFQITNVALSCWKDFKGKKQFTAPPKFSNYIKKEKSRNTTGLEVCFPDRHHFTFALFILWGQLSLE